MKLVPARPSVVKPSARRKFDIYIINKTQPFLILSKNIPLKKNSLLFQIMQTELYTIHTIGTDKCIQKPNNKQSR